MDLALSDKVVWITGASGGIGRSIAEHFAQEGARVALHGQRGFDELRGWVAEQPWRERALALRADLRRPAELERCAAQTRERWGRIDVCVANAGFWPPEELALHELGEERLRDTVEVDLLGPLFTARAFLRALAESGPRPDGHGAALVFVGSTAAAFGERGHVDYAAAKAGLVGAVRTLKNEIVLLDARARANLVQPGWTRTHVLRPALEDPAALGRAVQTVPLRRVGHADDVARAILWLSSPTAAAHVTGEVVTVAGGMEGRVLWGP